MAKAVVLVLLLFLCVDSSFAGVAIANTLSPAQANGFSSVPQVSIVPGVSVMEHSSQQSPAFNLRQNSFGKEDVELLRSLWAIQRANASQIASMLDHPEGANEQNTSAINSTLVSRLSASAKRFADYVNSLFPQPAPRPLHVRAKTIGTAALQVRGALAEPTPCPKHDEEKDACTPPAGDDNACPLDGGICARDRFLNGTSNCCQSPSSDSKVPNMDQDDEAEADLMASIAPWVLSGMGGLLMTLMIIKVFNRLIYEDDFRRDKQKQRLDATLEYRQHLQDNLMLMTPTGGKWSLLDHSMLTAHSDIKGSNWDTLKTEIHEAVDKLLTAATELRSWLNTLSDLDGPHLLDRDVDAEELAKLTGVLDARARLLGAFHRALARAKASHKTIFDAAKENVKQRLINDLKAKGKTKEQIDALNGELDKQSQEETNGIAHVATLSNLISSLTTKIAVVDPDNDPPSAFSGCLKKIESFTTVAGAKQKKIKDVKAFLRQIPELMDEDVVEKPIKGLKLEQVIDDLFDLGQGKHPIAASQRQKHEKSLLLELIDNVISEMTRAEFEGEGKDNMHKKADIRSCVMALEIEKSELEEKREKLLEEFNEAYNLCEARIQGQKELNKQPWWWIKFWPAFIFSFGLLIQGLSYWSIMVHSEVDEEDKENGTRTTKLDFHWIFLLQFLLVFVFEVIIRLVEGKKLRKMSTDWEVWMEILVDGITAVTLLLLSVRFFVPNELRKMDMFFGFVLMVLIQLEAGFAIHHASRQEQDLKYGTSRLGLYPVGLMTLHAVFFPPILITRIRSEKRDQALIPVQLQNLHYMSDYFGLMYTGILIASALLASINPSLAAKDAYHLKSQLRRVLMEFDADLPAQKDNNHDHLSPAQKKAKTVIRELKDDFVCRTVKHAREDLAATSAKTDAIRFIEKAKPKCAPSNVLPISNDDEKQVDVDEVMKILTDSEGVLDESSDDTVWGLAAMGYFGCIYNIVDMVNGMTGDPWINANSWTAFAFSLILVFLTRFVPYFLGHRKEKETKINVEHHCWENPFSPARMVRPAVDFSYANSRWATEHENPELEKIRSKSKLTAEDLAQLRRDSRVSRVSNSQSDLSRASTLNVLFDGLDRDESVERRRPSVSHHNSGVGEIYMVSEEDSSETVLEQSVGIHMEPELSVASQGNEEEISKLATLHWKMPRACRIKNLDSPVEILANDPEKIEKLG